MYLNIYEKHKKPVWDKWLRFLTCRRSYDILNNFFELSLVCLVVRANQHEQSFRCAKLNNFSFRRPPQTLNPHQMQSGLRQSHQVKSKGRPWPRQEGSAWWSQDWSRGSINKGGKQRLVGVADCVRSTSPWRRFL